MVGVYGCDAWSSGAEEGAVGEDEAEIGVELSDEGAGLGAEDAGGNAAAVQAENARECKSRVWRRCHVLDEVVLWSGQ